jgi:ubiquitin C-terminal hydrolase
MMQVFNKIYYSMKAWEQKYGAMFCNDDWNEDEERKGIFAKVYKPLVLCHIQQFMLCVDQNDFFGKIRRNSVQFLMTTLRKIHQCAKLLKVSMGTNYVFSSEKLPDKAVCGGLVYLEDNHYVLYVERNGEWVVYDDRIGSAMPTRTFKQIVQQEYLFRDQALLIYRE